MTLKDYINKTAYLAQEHGYKKALQSATNEATSKLLLRPYVHQLQKAKERELPSQEVHLSRIRAKDEYCIIVLDAGRFDYLAPILRDVFNGDCYPVFSDSRDTFEWISSTWKGAYDDVTYITGMVPVSDRIPDFAKEDFKLRYNGVNPGNHIGEIHKLWESHWDTNIATVKPEDITEYAEGYLDREKLVLHYNQPHSPYIGTPELLGHTNNKSATPKQAEPNDKPIWMQVRANEISDEYLVAAYIGNAVRAIQALQPIVEARDDVIITADHGEALGEFGMYTHDRSPHPKRRVVPWMTVTGINETDHSESEAMDINERLEALGYR